MLTCPTFGFLILEYKNNLDDLLEALVRYQIHTQGPLWRDANAR